MIQERPDERSVWRLDDNQRDTRDLTLELLSDLGCLVGVRRDADGPNIRVDGTRDVMDWIWAIAAAVETAGRGRIAAPSAGRRLIVARALNLYPRRSSVNA